MGAYFQHLPSPGTAGHCCLPTHTRGRNTPCSSRRKPLQKQSLFPHVPIPINSEVGSLQELPSVVWHPPPLLWSLAFKYHGTPSRHSQFLPFSPLGISTFSSLDITHVLTELSFFFLPLSSNTLCPLDQIPALR